MIVVRSFEQRDELVGRVAAPGGEDATGRKYVTYEYKYAASAKKALDRLNTAGVEASILE